MPTASPAEPEAHAAAARPQGHRGTRAIQRMVEYAPSTGGLALWVRHRDRPADEEAELQAAEDDDAAAAPPVVTDGLTITYGAAFEALPLPEQVGWVAHEVLHIALRHAQRFLDLQQLVGDADLALYNRCADAIVNSTLGHLGWLELPEGAIQLDRLLKHALDIDQPVEAALLEWDVERLYRALDPPGSIGGRRAERGASGGRRADRSARARRGRGGVQHDPNASPAEKALALGREEHADLRPAPSERQAPELEAQAAREWAERLTRAHAGDGAFSMLRALIADLPRVRTPWEQVLRTRLARCLTPQPELSWSRPSRSYLANQGRRGTHRRMPFEPGVGATRAVPRLVVVVDVSGSIADALMARFAREIEAITRRLHAGLTLVIGDDRVQRVQPFEPGRGHPGDSLRDIVFDGGGGTDFTPLLEEADRHDPDITVVLTDLDGPARHRPRSPVLWAVPEAHAAAVAPFGRKLVLD